MTSDAEETNDVDNATPTLSGLEEAPSEIDGEKLKQILTLNLEKVVQVCFNFVEYVSIMGKLTFEVDSGQITDVLISQTVFPNTEESTDNQENDSEAVTPLSSPSFKQKVRKSLRQVSKGDRNRGSTPSQSPTSGRKRGRGRPRKSIVGNAKNLGEIVQMEKEENSKSQVTVKIEKEESDMIDSCTPDQDDYEPSETDTSRLPECVELKSNRMGSDTEDDEYKPESKKSKTGSPSKARNRNEDWRMKNSTNPLHCYKCAFEAESEELLREHKLKTHGRYLCDKCPYVNDSKTKYDIHFQARHSDKNVACWECGEEFSALDKMKRHMRIYHTEHWRCPMCVEPKSHEFLHNLIDHLRTEHSMQEDVATFGCDYCKLLLLTQEEYDEHIISTHTHVCRLCDLTFRTISQLVNHRMKQHPVEALKCEQCEKACPTKSALFKHLMRHRDKGTKLKCNICLKEFTGKSSLFHHKRGMHTQEKKYKCDVCGVTFNFHHSLKLHKYKHTGQRPFSCTICSKSYLTSNHLKKHIQGAHSGKADYVCPICDKAFNYDNSLRMHLLLHEKKRPFLCDICSKTFVSKSALKAHKELHTAEMHQCTVCYKLYKTRMLLRAHMRRHTEDGQRYMCDICGSTFMYRSTLQAHISVHGDKRQHRCKVCGKEFKTYATLYSHRLVHEEANPHTCSICGKGFKTKERLKAHERRHTGEKPYKCELCGSSFPDRGGLSKHNKTVHARKPRFQCPICGKLANRADNLRVHMKMHNDPKLLALTLEELRIKESDGEPSLDCTESPAPTPRRRKMGPLQQSPVKIEPITKSTENAGPNQQLQQQMFVVNEMGTQAGGPGTMHEAVSSSGGENDQQHQQSTVSLDSALLRSVELPAEALQALMLNHVKYNYNSPTSAQRSSNPPQPKQHQALNPGDQQSPMTVVRDGRATTTVATTAKKVSSHTSGDNVTDLHTAGVSSEGMNAEELALAKHLSGLDKNLQKQLTAMASNIHHQQIAQTQNTRQQQQQQVVISQQNLQQSNQQLQHSSPASQQLPQYVINNPLLQLAEVMSAGSIAHLVGGDVDTGGNTTVSGNQACLSPTHENTSLAYATIQQQQHQTFPGTSSAAVNNVTQIETSQQQQNSTNISSAPTVASFHVRL